MNPSADDSAELAEARRRLAELEAVEAERAHGATLQGALYRIAELASAARDLQEFYGAIHDVISELMHASNFFIALYDDARQLISWPYYVDEFDTDFPDQNEWVAFSSRDGRAATGYVLRTGKSQLLNYERFRELINQGEIELFGVLREETSWVGVPLKSDSQTVGVLVVQSYLRTSSTASRTRSCSRLSASTSAPPFRERGRSRRRASATRSSR